MPVMYFLDQTLYIVMDYTVHGILGGVIGVCIYYRLVTGIRASISNHIHIKGFYVITHPCHNGK